MNRPVMYLVALAFALPILMGSDGGCSERKESADYKQQVAQERILQEGTAQTGMPAIVNFRERKILKDILEKRDHEGLVTYTYLFSEYSGRLTFFCDSVGYPIPYATQYTNPEKLIYNGGQYSYSQLPQADPNGLFSPASAEGTWVLCADPKGGKAHVVYLEPRVVVSPFRLDAQAQQPAEAGAR